MTLLEVFTLEGKWIPMQPAKHFGISYAEIRTAPQVVLLFWFLQKLGLKSAMKYSQGNI
jgi:hypothetical protein